MATIKPTLSANRALELLSAAIPKESVIYYVVRKKTRTINGNSLYKASFFYKHNNEVKLTDITSLMAASLRYNIKEVENHLTVNASGYTPAELIGLISVYLFNSRYELRPIEL